MGADIHLNTEVRREGRGWTYHPSYTLWNEAGFDYANSPVLRQYSLFALLAGVRNEPYFRFSPLFPDRGYPKDIDKAPYDANAEDWPSLGDHSFTWASFEELRTINWEEHTYSEIGLGRTFANCPFKRWVEGRLTEIAAEFGSSNVRVLIGFDS